MQNKLCGKIMYFWLIGKIREDKTLTEDEKVRRCANVMEFWVAEGKKFETLKKELVKDGALVIEKCCRYFEYWHKFKLLCEGKELSVENLSKINLDEVFKFRDSVHRTLVLDGD